MYRDRRAVLQPLKKNGPPHSKMYCTNVYSMILTSIGVLDEHNEVKPTMSLKYIVTESKASAVTGLP